MWELSELIARIFRRKPAEVDLGTFRYRAFLSYRSTDQKAARRLHEKLERYRVPKELVEKPCDFGTVPPAVGRIFRDREELRTSEDIETIISEELSKAQQLIVFCTPRAVEPEAWVGREIELFRKRRPDGRVHAVIGDGEPPACFPSQLFRVTPEDNLRPPLAADLRPRKKGGQDRELRAVIKIVSGLIGVSFDDLWQREKRRRQRRQMALGIAVAVFLSLAGAVGYWVDARSTALEADARNTAARTYWQQARGLTQSDPLLSLHLMTEAIATAADLKLRNAVLLDHVQKLKGTRLLASWDFTGDEQLGSGSFNVVLQDSGKTAIVWRKQRLGRVNLTTPETGIKELVAPGSYEGAQFNLSGTRIVLWTKDGEAEVRETANGGSTSPRVKHGSRISRAGFVDNDGAFFTADSAGNVRVWDTQSGAPLGKAELEGNHKGGSLKHLAVSTTRAFIVTEHKEQLYESHYLIARLWDLKTQKVLATRDEGHVDPGKDVGAKGVFTRDGRRMLTWTDDLAWVLDAQNGVTRSLGMFHPKEKLQGAMFDDDEQRIVTWTEKAIRTWDIPDGSRSATQHHYFGFTDAVNGLMVDKNRNTLTAWGKNGTVRTWDLSTGAPSGPPIRHRPALDGERATRWDLDGDAAVNRVRMNKSGDRLLSWMNDSSVRVWNTQTGVQSAFAMSHRDLISGAVFTTDESTVLTWSVDGVLRLWAIETPVTRPTRKLLATTFGSSGLRPSMGPRLHAINEDPGFLLTWSADGEATIWDVAKGVPVTKSASLKDVGAPLWNARQTAEERKDREKKGPGVAFNRQGTRLVVYGGSDPMFVAKLWDTERTRPLADVGNPEHVTFNREGTFFATWNEKGALTLRRSSDGQATRAEVKLTVERKTPREKNPVERVKDVVINGAGTRLAVVYPDDGDGDPSVRVWAVDQGKYIGSYIDPATAVRFSPRGDRLALWRNILRGGDVRTSRFAALVDATSGEMISDRKISMDEWNQS